jgi:hypothetical protein
MRGRTVHRSGTVVLSLLMLVIGVALIVQALGGSGSVTGRLLLGALFIAGGGARLYIERKRGRRA